MTEQELLQQMEELQKKLDEIRAGKAAFSVSASLTEAEKEKQHQEDLQRLRGLRLIDDDFMNACFDGYTVGDEKGVAAMCKVMEDMRNESEKKLSRREISNLRLT